MDQQTQTDSFAIAATVSLQDNRYLALKHGDGFGVFDQLGNIVATPGGTEGLYWRDTRHLSEYDLRLDGVRPILLSATLRDDNATLTCDLTNPDMRLAGGQALENDVLHIRRSRFLWRGTCHERMSVRNFGQEALAITLELRFGADFADLFEVRGMRRARHGTHEPAQVAEDGVTLAYVGLDGARRATRLRFCPGPAVLDEGRAQFRFELPPHGRALVFVEIGCAPEPPTRAPDEAFLVALVEQRRWVRTQSARAAAVATSNEAFNEAMRRAISDLTMLVTEKPTGPYPYAGIPWFSTAFGRDALITGLLTLWLDPGISQGVLRYLAANQASALDPAADAEPGKILHEVRHGEMAQLGEVPFRHYYGSIDSTPLFLMLAGAYLDRTGDLPTLRALWPNIEAALRWIDEYGDRDRDGFVEYFRQTEQGLANQGWKDSFDSIFHADGTLAEGPIALCEVQAYVYAARRGAARIARVLGNEGVAAAQEAAAERLRQAFEAQFWCEEIGTYALALDGRKQPCRVRSSNAGQVLMSGIAAPERARRVAHGLMDSRFFSGWGIRTIASAEARYNPMSYHNGSVWPHDNALIALGLARYGMKEEVGRLFGALFDASGYIALRRMPELFCGFARRRGQGPTFYPVACSPQAWAAVALPSILASCLGLGFDPGAGEVIFDTPRLPPGLDEVKLLHLEVRGSTISVVLRRSGHEASMAVLDRQGPVRAVLRS